MDERLLQWLQACAAVDAALVADDDVDPLALVAAHATDLLGGDVATIALATPDESHLIVEAAAGIGADRLLGSIHPVAGTAAGEAFSTGRPVLLENASGAAATVHLAHAVALGSVLVVPIPGPDGMRGALALGRRAGSSPFGSADTGTLTALAGRAAVAVELAEARRGQRRMLLLEDRDRIARDLHDHVIQRLFAAGLTLQGMAVGAEPADAEKLGRVVEGIDETISQIRTSIFGLRGHVGPRAGVLRSRVLAVLAEVRPGLTAAPLVRFAGPLDTAVPDELVDEVVTALRDLLLEVSREAGPTSLEVALRARDGSVEIEVVDHDTDWSTTQARAAVSDLRAGAQRLGGAMHLGPAAEEGSGTRLRWAVPLR